MNFNFKTLCSASVLCFAGNVFAMDYNPLDAHSTTRGPGPWTSISRKEKNLSIEDLRRETCNLQQQNASLQQKIETYTRVLAEVLNPIIQTENEEVQKQKEPRSSVKSEEVREQEYKELKSAVTNIKFQKIKSLIAQGVDIDETVDGKYYTVLMHALSNGPLAMVSFLLKHGADLKKSPNALSYLVRIGKKKFVEWLVDHGADINQVDSRGWTPLFYACRSGNLDLVMKYLVENGGDINKENKDGKTPLLYACNSKNLDLVKYLVENGGDINKENKDGKTPLFYACKSGNKDLVKYLVENGADINKANKDGKTPLSIAREKEHFEIAKYLAEHGADINRDSLQQQNATLLQQVETYKNVLAEVLEQIIQNNGADLKKFPKCLDVAVEAEAKDLLELLIKYGADLEKALLIAIREEKKDLVEFLLKEKGADLKKSPEAFACAVKTGNEELFKLMIENGADPNYLDEHGNSVLMIALKKGYARIAKLFLSIYSANAHFKHYDTLDEDKNSPLVYAISSKEISDSDLLEIVKLLIENKVNVNWSTKGVSVLRIAKIFERDERIIELLENAGAIEFYEGKNAIIRLYDYIKILGIEMSNVGFKYDILPRGKYNCNVTIEGRKYIQEEKKYDTKREAKEGAAAFALDWIKNGCDPSMRFEKYLKHPRTQFVTPYDLSDIKFIDEDNGDGTHNCKIDIPEKPEHRIINLNLRCRSPEGARSAIKSYFLKSEAWKDFLK